MSGIITFTTDFGVGSPYVAAMKGVALGICPTARLIDITHGVPPQDVPTGAMTLADACFCFPKGTVHVAVVDPGVGTERSIIAAEIDGHFFVLPDNGLLSLIASRTPPTRIVRVENREFWREEISNTFHGRDIMAPVAAHLAAGVELERLGPNADAIEMLDWPEPEVSKGWIVGQVLVVDSFGNCITNVEHTHWDQAQAGRDAPTVTCNGHAVKSCVRTYGEASPGDCIALFGSNGRLEIAIVNGDAAGTLQIGVGAEVVVQT